MEIENEKKAIKMKIKKLNEDRNALVSEQENFNPEKYDEIRVALSSLPKQKEICLPLPLVQRLTASGFDIPQSQEEIDELIKKISCSKKDFLKISDDNIRKIEEKISKLDLKIEEEKKILDSMPKTDIKLKREEMFSVN